MSQQCSQGWVQFNSKIGVGSQISPQCQIENRNSNYLAWYSIEIVESLQNLNWNSGTNRCAHFHQIHSILDFQKGK